MGEVLPSAPAEREALIRKLQEMLGQLQALPRVEQVCEVTVCVPCGPWALRWLWRTIEALTPDYQSMPLIVHATAQESAKAEAGALEAGADDWKSNFRDFKLVQVVPNTGNSLANICESRRLLAQSVETPYVMFVDSDVRVPAGGARLLLDALKKDEKLGLVGINYALAVDHVQLGCTMMRTRDAKDFSWNADHRCECHALNAWFKTRGFDVKHLDGITAEHRS